MKLKDLLEMLDEPEVQAKIRNIAKKEPTRNVCGGMSPHKDTRVSELEAQVADLQEKLNKSEFAGKALEMAKNECLRQLQEAYTANESLKGMNQKLETKLQDMQDELTQLKNAVTEAMGFCQRYETLDRLYEDYKSLSEDVKKGLENSICTKDVYTFIVSASQWDSIDALWRYLDYSIETLSQEEVGTLLNTFDWLFDEYNQRRADYVRLSVEVGDYFDSDYHVKASNSKSSGAITQVLLLGYKDNNTGKVIRKSIVRV